MKKSVIIVVLIILISFISFAQEPGKLWINNVEIPFTKSLFNENYNEFEKSLAKEVVEISKQISYVYANGQRIAKVQDGEVYYFHNDHLGSPRVITDSNGIVVEKIDYLPFGESFEKNEKISYNSKELDKDTKLNYYGARYYSSATGRFITADTVKGSLVDPQSLNLYVYTKNNPMKFVDPSGNQEQPPLDPGIEEVSKKVEEDIFTKKKKLYSTTSKAGRRHTTTKIDIDPKTGKFVETEVLIKSKTKIPKAGTRAVSAKGMSLIGFKNLLSKVGVLGMIMDIFTTSKQVDIILHGSAAEKVELSKQGVPIILSKKEAMKVMNDPNVPKKTKIYLWASMGGT